MEKRVSECVYPHLGVAEEGIEELPKSLTHLEFQSVFSLSLSLSLSLSELCKNLKAYQSQRDVSNLIRLENGSVCFFPLFLAFPPCSFYL
jgi:hypothetical protein